MDYRFSKSLDDHPVFAVLADPTRRAPLGRLRKKVLPVGELASLMPVTRPAVYQHLKIHKEARLIREHRRGTRHYFSLDPAGLTGLRKYANPMWQEALNAFAPHVSAQPNNPRKHRVVPPKLTRRKER